jgi:hypothetical protein
VAAKKAAASILKFKKEWIFDPPAQFLISIAAARTWWRRRRVRS